MLSLKMAEDKDIDLENCVTASTKQINGLQPSPGSNAGKDCAIAVQHLDRRAVLINITVKEGGDGDLVLSSARRQLSHAITKSWNKRLLGKLFMGLVVGTARVTSV